MKNVMQLVMAAIVSIGLALGSVTVPYAQAQSSPYSNSTYAPITLTGVATSAPIQLAPSQSGTSGAYSVGNISLTGVSLTTVTFAVLGSTDGGATYTALPVSLIATPGTSATSTTATTSGVYQVNLAGITHIEVQTTGTFTATSVKFLLTATPVGIVARATGNTGSATNLAGGAANDIPYQTGAGATSFITPVNNAVLVTNGSGVPSESTTLPSAVVVPLLANQVNLCSAPFYASCTQASNGLKGFATTTSGTTAPGTTVLVASAGDWAASNAGVNYGHEGIYIPGAGVSGAGYIGTVTSVSGTTLTVTPATSTSVASGTTVLHDETAAIQAAVSLANYTTPTQITCPVGVFNINGPFRDTGTFDSIIEMPTFSYNDSLNVNAPAQIIFNGSTTLTNFGAGVQGCTLRTDAVDTVNGGAGAVFAANGGSNGVSPIPISNISVTFSNVHLETNQNPQVSFINGTNFAAMMTDNVSLDTGVPTNCFYFEGDGCTTAFITPTHTAQVGIATPGQSNIGQSIVRNTSVTGQYTNLLCQEHCYMDKVWLNWSVNCLELNTATYYGKGTLVNAEHCTNIIQPPATGFSGIQIDLLAVETSTPTSSVLINDPSSVVTGWVNVQASGPYTINGAGSFDVYDLPTRAHLAGNHCDINQNTVGTSPQVYFGQFSGSLQMGVNRNPCTGAIQFASETTASYGMQVGTTGSSTHSWGTTSTINSSPVTEMSLGAGLSIGTANVGTDPGDGNLLSNQVEVKNSANGGEQSYFGTFAGLVNFSYNRIPSTGVIPNPSESAAYINISGTSSASSVSVNVSPTANTQPLVEALFTPTGDTFSHTIAAPQLLGTGTAPTCTLGAASGSNSGSACASITGKNLAGRITITTGTATTASATLATITFGGTVTTAPQGCSLQPTNANAVGQNLMVFSNYPTTSGWTIGVAGTPVPASTTFTYSYSCF